MAKMKCRHAFATGTCDPNGAVMSLHCAGRGCNARLSIGPSNDDIPSEELLAAELAQNPDVLGLWLNESRRINDDLARFQVTPYLYLGYATPDAKHAEMDPPARWSWVERRDYWAGWLAREMSEGPLTDAECATIIAQSSDSFMPVDTAAREPWADPNATTRMTDDEIITSIAYSPPGSVQDSKS